MCHHGIQVSVISFQLLPCLVVGMSMRNSGWNPIDNINVQDSDYICTIPLEFLQSFEGGDVPPMEGGRRPPIKLT